MDFAQELSDIRREEEVFTLEYKKKQLVLADKLEDFNRRCSPFLRLPGEIRNKIYLYSIEKCRVHVWVIPDDGGLQTTIEMAAPEEPGHASESPIEDYNPYRRRKQKKTVRSTIHRETFILMFTPHDYHIEPADKLNHFLKRIGQMRAHALQNLGILFSSKTIEGAGVADSLSKSLQPLVLSGQLNLFTLVVYNPFLLGAHEKLLDIAADLRRSSIELSQLNIQVQKFR